MSEWMLSENHPKAFRMFPTSITACEHGANFLPCIVQFDWFISEQLRYSLNIYSSFEKRCRRKMCSWQGNMGYHQYNLRSGSIFVSLWKLHFGGQSETKRDPDTNLLRNVCRPLFWLIGICRISKPKLLPLLVFLVCKFFAWENCRLADLTKKSFIW